MMVSLPSWTSPYLPHEYSLSLASSLLSDCLDQRRLQLFEHSGKSAGPWSDGGTGPVQQPGIAEQRHIARPGTQSNPSDTGAAAAVDE